MALRAAVDAGAGGTIVTSVTGTANQVTASPTTGAVIVGLAPISQIATSLAIGGAAIGTNTLAVAGITSLGGAIISAAGMIDNTAAGQDIRSGANLQADSGSAIRWLSRAMLKSSADGVINAFFADGSTFSAFNVGIITAAGKLTFTAATAGVVLKQGANGLCGTFVANGATPVVVSNTNIAITDSIIISLNTIGGTVGVQPHVSAITGATSFAVTCTAVDTSTYNYAIIKNAA